MVKIKLELKAELENVSDITAAGEDFRWYLKLKCSNCGDVPDVWQYVTLNKTALKSGRGEASLVVKCKLCQRENSLVPKCIQHDVLEQSVTGYSSQDNDFRPVVTFDCRGVEPVDFSPRGGWRVKASESNTIFQEVSLSDKEWVDYDNKAKLSVGIYDLQHQFVKSK